MILEGLLNEVPQGCRVVLVLYNSASGTGTGTGTATEWTGVISCTVMHDKKDIAGVISHKAGVVRFSPQGMGDKLGMS